MKKLAVKTGVTLFIALLALGLAGCPTDDDGGGGGGTTQYTVSFELQEGLTLGPNESWPEPKKIKANTEIKEDFLPPLPLINEEDYQFTKWVVKGDEQKPVVGYKVTRNITLLAYYTNTMDQTSALLTRIMLDGSEAALGIPAEDIDKVIPGSVTVTNRNNVPVAFTPESNITNIEWTTVSRLDDVDVIEANLSRYDANANDTARLIEGETRLRILVVKVTSYDGTNIRYYVVNVRFNVTVKIASITVGSYTLPGTYSYGGISKTYALPTSDSEWNRTIPVQVLVNTAVQSSPVSLAISAVAADVDARVKWAKEEQGGQEPIFGTESHMSFNDTDSLIVKVHEPDDEEAAVYYRVLICIWQRTSIRYGRPEIKENVIDSAWESAGNGHHIRKVYTGDSTLTGNALNEYLRAPTTTGVARFLFDETGLYVYVDVTDDYVSVRPPSSVPVGDYWKADSVEIFVNEDFAGHPSGSYNSVGGLYRIGANGELSGDPVQAVTAMQTLNKTAAWKKPDSTGYIITAHIPWRFKSNYPLVDKDQVGKTIGVEVQINESRTGAERRLPMVWNNIVKSSYQDIANFNEASLALGGYTLAKDAVLPVFTVHPASAWYRAGSVTGVLSANAGVNDSGAVSYQWYQASSWTAAGTALPGATNRNLSLSGINLPVGIYYFYAKAINRNPAAPGDVKESSANSIPARIQVFADDNAQVVVEQLTLQNSYAIYQFTTLPPGEVWDNYKTITVDYKLDAANLAKGVASLRLMGNYRGYDWTRNGDRRMVAPWNDEDLESDKNRPYVYHDTGVDGGTLVSALSSGEHLTISANPAADAWFTVTYPLGNGDGPANNPGANFDPQFGKQPTGESGPFFLGIGIPGRNSAITQLVKNVTLVHKDDPGKNVVSYSSGIAGTAFTGYNNSTLTNSERFFRTEVPTPPANRTFTFNVKNTEPITDRYQLIHTLDLGDDFDITPYTQITAVIRFYNASNQLISTVPESCSTLKYLNRLGNKIMAGNNDDEFSFGRSFPISIRSQVLSHADGVRYLTIDSADASQSSQSAASRVVYIEVESITFVP